MIEISGSPDVPHVVINRPDRANALTIALLEELAATVTQVGSSSRAFVLTGAGGRFCAGADLDEMTGTASDIDFDLALGHVTNLITVSPATVVCAVEKYALGAGVDLAWSCDVVVAAHDVRVAVPATSLGILYNPEALRRLHARLGSRALRQLFIAGRELNGALLADAVAAPGEALSAAEEIARGARDGVASAVEATKRVLNDLDHGRDHADS